MSIRCFLLRRDYIYICNILSCNFFVQYFAFFSAPLPNLPFSRDLFEFTFWKQNQNNLHPRKTSNMIFRQETMGWLKSFQKQSSRMFYKKGALKKFVKFTGKHLRRGHVFNKVQVCNSIKKKDSETGAFLWILWNFKENVFYKHHRATASNINKTFSSIRQAKKKRELSISQG